MQASSAHLHYTVYTTLPRHCSHAQRRGAGERGGGGERKEKGGGWTRERTPPPSPFPPATVRRTVVRVDYPDGLAVWAAAYRLGMEEGFRCSMFDVEKATDRTQNQTGRQA